MDVRNITTPVYMDYQATTPLDERVLEAMMPFLTDKFGNPHSTTHKFGWEASDGVEKARVQVASLIGAEAREMTFTSGATESNNLAIKGVGRKYRKYRNHIITAVTEHKCVVESVAAMEREGMDVTWLDVKDDGLIDLKELEAAMTDQTMMVSIMAVNNEIGVIQPLAEIGRMCRERRILFHTDAAQAVGKIPLDVEAMNIDLLSISGHKIYGPKGIGALYIRRKSRLQPEPTMSGGGQENGLRSGTLSPALCTGLGQACELAAGEYEAELSRTQRLFDRFVDGVRAGLDGVRLNGHREERWPGNISLSFEGVDADRLVSEMRDLAVSSGAACASALDEKSYVLEAIGLPEKLAQATLRFGIGRQTTDMEVDFAIETVIETVSRLREETQG
ncbi:MAG: aminotransferase class V-fold PLP-dependent enzyme [Alphaproteobacteria bacterium]|nr:aminotransferase class V-fold PLP-dependent enzyme [Alphaproteobacteria bacterium]